MHYITKQAKNQYFLRLIDLWYREPDLNRHEQIAHKILFASGCKATAGGKSYIWYREPDLNRHGQKVHKILSLACLPIPPSRHKI